MRESYEIFRRVSGPTHPETLVVVGGLLDLQVLRGGWADSEIVLLEVVPAVRSKKDTPLPLVAELRHRLGWVRLRLGKYAEAEPDLRAGLEHREKVMSESWATFNTKSMLGGALLGQKKFDDAEPLLLAGYEGMKQREALIPAQAKARIQEALDRLIELSTATNKPDNVKKWRAERAKYPPEQAPPPREKK